MAGGIAELHTPGIAEAVGSTEDSWRRNCVRRTGIPDTRHQGTASPRPGHKRKGRGKGGRESRTQQVNRVDSPSIPDNLIPALLGEPVVLC